MKIYTAYRKLKADLHTPVSLYLKLRDKYSNPLLLESSDYHAGNESTSLICLNPLSEFYVNNNKIIIQYKREREEKSTDNLIQDFCRYRHSFETEKLPFPFPYAGFFGYTSYSAVRFFENISCSSLIPDLYYAFYSLVIVINHFHDEMYVFSHNENFTIAEEQLTTLLTEIACTSFPQYSFSVSGQEKSDCSDEDFIQMVRNGKQHCRRGDVFQVVLSRKFEQKFTGDDFEVYRALRNVNPSPYLFYFDFGGYKIFGSSPEAQLVVNSGKAEIHPIAGTVKRSGDDTKDLQLAETLKKDEKENAEHIMLVDLARNDLSRHCKNVEVETLREIQFFSHVIHLVSKVTGELDDEADHYELMKDSFPAGTLSGAPKVRAMQIIAEQEKSDREFYGGAVGFISCKGSFNHAIVIRSFLCRNNTLTYRAGAGIVDASGELSELREVDHKVAALRKAIQLADRSNENKSLSTN